MSYIINAAILFYKCFLCCLRTQIDAKEILFQQTLLHHVVHKGHGIASSKRCVGQTKNSIKWSLQEGLAWLVSAQTNLLIGDLDASKLTKVKKTGSLLNAVF